MNSLLHNILIKLPKMIFAGVFEYRLNMEGLHEAEKLVEKYLRSMTASEVEEEISYYRSTLSSSVPKMFGLSRAS
jgi:hypothetical protein